MLIAMLEKLNFSTNEGHVVAKVRNDYTEVNQIETQNQ